MDDDPSKVTVLLQQLKNGNRQAEHELVPIVYGHLHRIAGQLFRSERPGHTLQPTALISELYLRILRNSNIDWQSRAHLFAVAAQTMRRILVDHARASDAQRRPSPKNRVSLEDALIHSREHPLEVLALDEALNELARLEARQARVVEMRFFGGLTVEETAAVLGIAERTAKEDWRLARAWLSLKLGGQAASSAGAGG